MTTAHHTSGHRPARIPTVYLTVWAILAAMALSYLALLVVRPDMAESLLQRSPSGAPDDNRNQRAMARMMTELRDLKQHVTHLEREISDIRLTVTAGDSRNELLASRLGAVETSLKSVVAPRADIATAPTGPGAMVRGYVEERTAKEVPAKEAPVKEGSVKEAKDVAKEAKEAKSAAATRTAAAPPATAAKAPLTVAATGPLGVQIASGPSLDSLRLSWQLIQESHKAQVAALEPRVTEVPGNPSSYRLVAGPLATPDEAEKLCERLRTRRVTCAVTPFAGSPL